MNYKAIFTNSPNAILVSNQNAKITFVNHNAMTLFGYTEDELLALSINDLLPERFRVNHAILHAKFISEPTFRLMGEQRNVLILRKDGRESDVEIYLSFIQDDDDISVVSILHDTSERKRIEAVLKANEQRFRSMADSSPSMIWVTDISGNPIFVNKTWLNFTNISLKEALTYEGWNQAIHPDDKKNVFNLFYTKSKTNETITTEYRLKRADGNWRWILDNGVPFYNENNEFSGYIGSAIDITERKQAEIESRIAAIAFESYEAMVITDVNTVILKVNRNFSETTGYSSDELIGHKMNLLKSGKHDDNFYVDMWEQINLTGIWQGEIWDKRKNGELYLKWLTITAIKNENDIVTNYVGTHVDITERKKAQDEIEQLAFYDPLTCLPNRRLLLNRLEHAIISSKRNKKYGTLMFIDIDNFKTLNDTLGHDMGDELLQKIALRLKACVRECDTVARLGGDEFVVMLEELSIVYTEAVAQSRVIAEKILFSLNQNYHLKKCNYSSTPSIGIVLFNKNKNSADELLKKADIAMYQAKKNGGNTVRFFNPSFLKFL